MKKNIEEIETNKQPLEELFKSFRNGIFAGKSERPREFLAGIGLNHQYLEVGFNSGQFHHNTDDEFKVPYIELGVLTVSGVNARKPDKKSYNTIGDYGLIFPLKDEVGSIVNYYAHRIKLKTPKGEYLNGSGVYPAFPTDRTNRLFITESVIDAASFIQSQALENRDSVLALFDGVLSVDLKQAISGLTELEQIVIVTGESDSNLIEELKELTKVQVSELITPDGDSLNEMWLKYGTDGLIGIIDEVEQAQETLTGFNQLTDREFFYHGSEVTYHIHGVIPQNPTFLEMDFVIESDWDTFRGKLDLIDEAGTNHKLYNWTDDKDLNCPQIIQELGEIKAELERIRREQNNENVPRGFSTKQDKEAKKILRSKDLFNQLNNLIGKTGIIGQEKSRLLLFLIASSYKFKYVLHAVTHAGDKIAASDLILKIANLIPEKEQYLIDLTASRTFRYFGNSAITNKLVVIPDYSGVTKSKAISDFKRLQAQGKLINDAPVKGKTGELHTIRTVVDGHCSSIGACGTTKRYFEDEPRTVLVRLDEGPEQMQKLMEYDTMLMAGEVNLKGEERTRELLQYVVKNIHPLEVVNPFARALMLPMEIRNARMLTLQLQQFTAIVTLFRQHQREKDKQGRVISTKEDVKTAIDLFLDTIVLNVDELDAGTREFFEKLKAEMLKKESGKDTKLTSFEIQKALNISKSHANRFLNTLTYHEFIKKDGHKNTGFSYQVTNWDELSSLRDLLLNRLGEPGEPNKDGSPKH